MSDTTKGPIFILASGQRCGSTLLQRFLCSHPDVMIWGEHDGILNNILKQFDRLDKWETMFGHMFTVFLTQGVNNFIPNMNPPKAVIRQTQINMLETLWKSPAQAMNRDIWGFKEVLYHADMAQKLHDLFPDARIIYLSRNIFECFISLIHEENIGKLNPYLPDDEVWDRKRTKQFIGYWTSINRSFVETPGLLEQDWIYPLKYEELTGDTEHATQELADWLGLSIDDFDMDVFNYKLYTDRPAELGVPDQRPKITRADLSAEDVALVTTDEILEVSEKLGFDMSIVQPEIAKN